MSLPEPRAGLVIRYSYLWYEQSEVGSESGVKDRPCLILHAAPCDNGSTRVIVVPITRTPPQKGSFSAVELPLMTKERLGLAKDRMWILCSEANEFDWAGPDLCRIPKSNPPKFHYGFLGQSLLDKVKEKFLFIAKGSQLKVASRSS